MFRFLILVLFIGLLGSAGFAQVIRININVPAGFELRDVANAATILEPIPSEANFLGNRSQGIRWIELRANESVTYVMSMRHTGISTVSRKPIFLLNDGSSNFSRAKAVPPGEYSFVSKFADREDDSKFSLYTSAWVGLPEDINGILTINYH